MILLAVTSTTRARADEPVPEQAPPPTDPAPAAQAPPEVPRERAPKPPRASGVTGRFHGGLGQRALFEDSILGADLTASLGGYIDTVSIYADLQMLFASDNGLAFRQFRVGPSIDFEVISRLRLGAGLSAGGTTLTRATTGKTMEAWSWGARILGSVDLFQSEGRTAVYVLGQLSVDTAGTFLGSDHRRSVATAVMWGPTVAAGVRF
ncbi:MAG TPA: hypothetical protein VLT33_00610 [Labilithrix sp.]|nr:hypothetical protein [Labilithrix sp.]